MRSIKILTDISFFISRKSNEKFYEFKLAGLLFLLSCFFSSPNVFFFFFQDALPSAWNTVILKSKDLTNNLNHIEPYSWQAKKVFRLSIPILMKVFNLSPHIIVILQILAGYFMFIFSYKLAFRISKDSVQSTFFTAGIAFLYFGKAAFFEMEYTWFDGFSYFFIIMAMWSRNIVGIILFSALAAWNDERAFIALSLVFLFHYFSSHKNKESISALIYSNKQALFVLLSIFAYIGLRLILTTAFTMKSPIGGVATYETITRTYQFFQIGMLSFFEGYWLLLFIFVSFLIMNRDYRILMVLFPLTVMILGSFCVADITRSGSFAFPIVFIAIHYLKDKLTSQEMMVILLICLMVSVLIPPIFICADWDIKNMLPQNTIFFILDHLKYLIKSNFL